MPKLRELTKKFRYGEVPKTRRRIQFRTVKGEKHINDRVLQINTLNQWANFTFYDILYILDFMFKNEDIVYFKGRDYLFNAIKDLYLGMSVEEVYTKYMRKKRL